MQFSRRTGRKQSPVPPASSSGSLPDGWFDVYRWFCHDHPAAVAEELTAEVCRRLGNGTPAWLAHRDAGVLRRFLVAQVVLERRGVLTEKAPGRDR